jgi:hypothetical protein
LCVWKPGLFENVAHRPGGEVPGMTTGGYISPHSLRTARRGVKICVIPEKEECGAVAGKYKKNPVRREREGERKETQRWRIHDADMLPLMLASADAFRDSYRCSRFLPFPSPHIQCPSSFSSAASSVHSFCLSQQLHTNTIRCGEQNTVAAAISTFCCNTAVVDFFNLWVVFETCVFCFFSLLLGFWIWILLFFCCFVFLLELG